jgi:DNA-binding MarR family transcriptional regulator
MSGQGHDRVRIGLLFQIFRTNEMSARLVTRALEPTGLRGDDYAVYSYLLHGPMSLTDLAEGTGMPLTTAAGYIKRFEERGNIVREPNPNDGRSQLLSLTPGAHDWILDVARIFTKTIAHLDAVLEAEGVDSSVLVEQLEHVQELIERALGDLNDPGI